MSDSSDDDSSDEEDALVQQDAQLWCMQQEPATWIMRHWDPLSRIVQLHSHEMLKQVHHERLQQLQQGRQKQPQHEPQVAVQQGPPVQGELPPSRCALCACASLAPVSQQEPPWLPVLIVLAAGLCENSRMPRRSFMASSCVHQSGRIIVTSVGACLLSTHDACMLC